METNDQDELDNINYQINRIRNTFDFSVENFGNDSYYRAKMQYAYDFPQFN